MARTEGAFLRVMALCASFRLNLSLASSLMCICCSTPVKSIALIKGSKVCRSGRKEIQADEPCINLYLLWDVEKWLPKVAERGMIVDNVVISFLRWDSLHR